MAANVLEMINLIIVFKLFLGCDFRKNRGFLFLGGLLAAGYMVMEEIPVCEDFFIAWGHYAIIPCLILIMSFLFTGNVWATAGISAAAYFLAITAADLLDNIVILLVKGDLLKVDFEGLYYVALILSMAGFAAAGKLLGKKKEIVREYLENMNPVIWVVIIGIFEIMSTEWAYTGGLTYAEMEIVRSYNLIKDGIVCAATLIMLCLLGILKHQKQVLQRTVWLNEKCMAEQAAQYTFLGEKDRALRAFRHDYNRHFNAVQMLLKEKKYEELEAYFEELKPTAEKLHFLNTNNLICDAIVNQYYLLCKEKGIDLSVSGIVKATLSVPQTDMCVILSNALENAMEATESCTEKKEIKLKIRNHGNLLFLDLRNPTNRKLSLKADGLPRTNKEDEKNHGLGTQNMKEAVERHCGDICWEYDSDGFVMTKVILPCEKI